MLLSITMLISCTDDYDVFESKTALLVDFQWFNSETIGGSPSGYAIVSPIIFKRDMTAYIGASQTEWQFIENSNSIKLIDANTNSSAKYEIINLSETEFHFKHYDGSGNFLIELVYDKCDRLSINPC